MVEANPPAQSESSASGAGPVPGIRVAPSPHLSAPALTTRRMMVDVLFGLVPVFAMALAVFRWYAVVQVGLCVLSCLAADVVLTAMRRKPMPIGDYSAAVTGVILGLSLPWSAPWYIAVLGSVAAIGLGKVVFGGLGFNLFNPAMVGRAFVMLSFARELGASAYVATQSNLQLLTQATPLAMAKQSGLPHEFWPLFLGTVNGSLGETSAPALLLGGIYVCVRRAASWEIPIGVLVAGLVCAAAAHWMGLTPLMPLHHMVSGALLFGAFFIATDPVTSPLTGKGKFIFGLGIGAITILIRLFSGYPEGVMFSVLLMNSAVPLINCWTIPRPLGGPATETT